MVIRHISSYIIQVIGLRLQITEQIQTTAQNWLQAFCQSAGSLMGITPTWFAIRKTCWYRYISIKERKY